MKCVQCHKELSPLIIEGKVFMKLIKTDESILNYCTDPACPNYGLLQIGE